jgi:hypothetical protein
MPPKRFLPLKSLKSFEPAHQPVEIKLPPSKKIIKTRILKISFFYLLDVVKIWDAVSAYIESYMKQSKVKLYFFIFHKY